MVKDECERLGVDLIHIYRNTEGLYANREPEYFLTKLSKLKQEIRTSEHLDEIEKGYLKIHMDNLDKIAHKAETELEEIYPTQIDPLVEDIEGYLTGLIIEKIAECECGRR